MGDTWSIVIMLPQAEDWVRDREMTVSLFSPNDNLLWSGLVLGGEHTTVYDQLQTAVAHARRHLRPYFH